MRCKTALLAWTGALLVLATVGCSGKRQRAWEEEVALLDGRTITFRQERRYERAYNGNATVDVPRESWLRFRLPETGSSDAIGGLTSIVGSRFAGREARQCGARKSATCSRAAAGPDSL